MNWKEHWKGYRFVGGNVALDFVNTVANRLAPGKPVDYLRARGDWIEWVRRAGLASCSRVAVSLRDAVRLREALYRILAAQLRGSAPGARELRLVNRLARRARGNWRLTHGRPAWRWQWAGAGEMPDPLAQVVAAAAELLTSEELGLLRQCRDAHCGWLFLDRSQGRRRKWCSMQDCGNRAKVRRFFAKRR